MTPKEHAQELVEKYSKFDFSTLSVIKQREYVKQCALIAVNEMLDMSKVMGCKNCCPNAEYWQEVKAEIESL